ncbi:hypothetical protein [uncultured Thiodictyon sp.]|uniref:hypothetical protein n=1 Tax=uncultured Thiodictyon sp. TaxID=1846217 RepID=UPI0025F447AB|nr:hypothetical protein [uncultured Thiodictyon sp.]
MVNRFWWVLFIVLIAAILGVVSAKFRPLAVPDVVRLAVPDPDCDLRAGPCTGRFAGGGALSLSVEPRGIPLARALELKVTTRDLAAGAVALDLAGVDMDMGYNRPSLAPAGSGLYRGEGMLPVCVRRRMTWEARVLLSTPDGLFAAPFRFETSR